MTRGRARVGIVIALLWVFVVIASYYIRHKPFVAPWGPDPDAASLTPALAALSGLAGAGLVLAAAAGVGLVATRSLGVTAAERLVWSAALGLGALSLAALGLGAAGLLRSEVLWPLTILLLAATARPLWRAARAAWRDASWRPAGRLQVWLAAFCALTVAATLIWAVMPPTAYDALVYHLTGPRLWLESGAVSHPLDLPYLGFPELVEMLFTWGMGLAGERAAAPIHLFFGLLAVGALVTAGRRWLGGAAGWVAAAVLLSAETVVLVAGWAYVDVGLLVYSTLAFLALARAKEDGAYDRRWILISGAMAGFALSTKYTALATILGLAAVLPVGKFGDGQARQAWKETLRSLLLLTGVALVIWLPWMVKNLVLTGNPTYPFFFGGIYWDDWRAWWYDRPGTGLAGEPLRLLTAAWDVTVWGVEGGAGYSATIGPLFLALAPLLALSWRRLPDERRRWLRLALIFFVVQYSFWLWGLARSALLQQTRLLFPAFGVLALISAAAVAGLRSLPRGPLDLGWVVRGAVAGVLVLALANTAYSLAAGRPVSVLLGAVSEDEYLRWRLGWHYEAIEAVNRVAGSDETVLFLWEPRTYYCEAHCLPDALLDRWLHAAQVHGHDAEAIAEAWRSQGVTHVLMSDVGYEYITRAGFDPITAQDRAALDELIDGHLEPLLDLGGAYTLYELR